MDRPRFERFEDIARTKGKEVAGGPAPRKPGKQLPGVAAAHQLVALFSQRAKTAKKKSELVTGLDSLRKQIAARVPRQQSAFKKIIDNEMVGAMRRFVRGFEVNENTLASEVIKEAGPGGTFLDKVHTARNFRGELWEPGFFTQFGFAHWMAAGAKSEAEKARDIFRDIIKKDAPPSRLSSQADAEMRGAIEKFCGVKLDRIELV